MQSLQNKPYEVLLADDHALVRTGLRKILETAQDIRIVGEASNGDELLEMLKHKSCELVILDLSMPGRNGLDVIKEMRRTHPDMNILVLTMHKEREYFTRAMVKNVKGYILKDDVYEKLLSAIREIRAGRKAYSAEIQERVMDEFANNRAHAPAVETLTRRENEILREIAAGKMNKTIAEELHISIRTVESHRANIMDKLGCRNVTELIKFAISAGIT